MRSPFFSAFLASPFPLYDFLCVEQPFCKFQQLVLSLTLQKVFFTLDVFLVVAGSLYTVLLFLGIVCKDKSGLAGAPTGSNVSGVISKSADRPQEDV